MRRPCLVASLSLVLLAHERSLCHANDVTREGWQQCDQFLAPSSLPGGGWGVFAARDFAKDEVVEVAPLFLPVDHNIPIVKNSVLDDYVYGYNTGHSQVGGAVRSTVVVVGNTMFYNHHPEPNLVWSQFGMEPSPSQPTSAQSVGFVAKRDIQAGEELFSTYGIDDGGKQWFQARRISLMEVPQWASRKNGTELLEAAKRYCPKIHATVGLPSWKRRIIANQNYVPYWFLDADKRLAPVDAGWGTATASIDVSAGEILESAPALALFKIMVDGTSIAPLLLPSWDKLTESHRSSLRALQASGDLRVQYQGDNTDWVRVHQEWEDFHQISIFPASARMALVKRVGDQDDANCRLEIQSPESSLHSDQLYVAQGSMGIVLHLIATKDIKSGELLKVNLPPSGTPEEIAALLEVLETTGQPLPYKAEHAEQGDEL